MEGWGKHVKFVVEWPLSSYLLKSRCARINIRDSWVMPRITPVIADCWSDVICQRRKALFALYELYRANSSFRISPSDMVLDVSSNLRAAIIFSKRRDSFMTSMPLFFHAHMKHTFHNTNSTAKYFKRKTLRLPLEQRTSLRCLSAPWQLNCIASKLTASASGDIVKVEGTAKRHLMAGKSGRIRSW